MRILHVYRTYFPDKQGGLEEAIRNICISNQSHGIESRIFTLSPNPYPRQIEAKEGIIIRTRSWCSPASCDIGGYDALRSFMQHSDWADLIHFHYPWPFADILNLFSKSIKPKVLTYHSDIVKQKKIEMLYAPLRNYTLNSMDAIIATSHNYALSSPILKKYVDLPKLKIIPLGILGNRYENVDLNIETSLLKSLNIKENQYFLFLGVLRYYKGLHTLIKAAKQIKGTIVIAGMGPEYQNLKALGESLGASNLIFTGEVTEAQKLILLKNCFSLILPSHLRSEAFGMVLVEAAMHGKPMISCEISTGTSFVNVNNLTGLVINPDNPEQLSSAANILLENPLRARNFGLAARKRYEAIFSGLSLGNAHYQLYKEVIDRISNRE